MNEASDHYEILQVHPAAHVDVIQAAYRRLALLYHPDRNKSAEAAEMMKRLNIVYGILSEPERRAVYDRARAERRRTGAANSSPGTRTTNPRCPESGCDVELPSWEAVLHHMVNAHPNSGFYASVAEDLIEFGRRPAGRTTDGSLSWGHGIIFLGIVTAVIISVAFVLYGNSSDSASEASSGQSAS